MFNNVFNIVEAWYKNCWTLMSVLYNDDQVEKKKQPGIQHKDLIQTW